MIKINWLEILFWIVMIALFIMILSRLVGSSATDIQIYLGLFTGLFIIMGYIIKLIENNSSLNRELGEMKTNMVNSFERVKSDMNKINEDISMIKNDTSKIKEKLKIR